MPVHTPFGDTPAAVALRRKSALFASSNVIFVPHLAFVASSERCTLVAERVVGVSADRDADAGERDLTRITRRTGKKQPDHQRSFGSERSRFRHQLGGPTACLRSHVVGVGSSMRAPSDAYSSTYRTETGRPSSARCLRWLCRTYATARRVSVGVRKT